MEDLFPNDYRVPMRRAYLEADRQSAIENTSRDYALTKRYFDAASELYNSSVKPGDSDPNMQKLEGIIEQLRNSNWIRRIPLGI
jgi:serine/threonine-protein kinase